MSLLVKALEWREEGDEDDVWALIAIGLSCGYEVFHRASDVAKIGVQVARVVPTDDGGQATDILGYGQTVEAAKAIAQADHDIRSALIGIPGAEKPVGWINGEREILCAWLSSYITDLKQDHARNVDVILRLERLNSLLSSGAHPPAPTSESGTGVTLWVRSYRRGDCQSDHQ